MVKWDILILWSAELICGQIALNVVQKWSKAVWSLDVQKLLKTNLLDVSMDLSVYTEKRLLQPILIISAYYVSNNS